MTATTSNVDGPGLDMEHEKDNAREGPSFVTLCPYIPKKKQKTARKTINFEELFGPEKWTKYYEINSPVKDDFLLYSALAKEVGADVLFRRQKDGPYIIEAANEEQSEKLERLVKIGDPSLPVKNNETLNVCHGTIVLPNSIETGDTEFSKSGEKIKENLRIQGHQIKDVCTYVKPARNNRKYPLRIAKITFEGRNLPEIIVVAGQRLFVKEYVPAPRQCNKCWKFGHGVKYCNADVYICPICSMRGHQKDNCTNKSNKICINCQGSHPAYSKSFTHSKKEQLIAKT